MTQNNTEVGELRSRLNLLGRILKVAQAAFTAGTEEELSLYIVNESVKFFNAENSYLFERSRSKLLAVSHAVEIVPTESARALTRMLNQLPAVVEPFIATENALPEKWNNDDWKIFSGEDKKAAIIVELTSSHSGIHYLWVLVFTDVVAIADLSSALSAAKVLGSFFSEALARFAAMPGNGKRWLYRFVAGKKRKVALIILILCVGILFIPIRDNVSAPLELKVQDDHVVFAPFTGTLRKAYVIEGENVNKDAPILEYDREEGELKLLQASSRYETAKLRSEVARKQALRNKEALADAELLALDAVSEAAEMKLMQWYVDHSVLKAPAAGRVYYADPDKLLNRVVQQGERLFEIVPEENALIAEIFLNEKDGSVLATPENLDFSLYLHNRPESVLSGKIVATSPRAIPLGPNQYGYRIRIELDQDCYGSGSQALYAGMRGVARLYGNRISIGYYLFRNLLFWWRNL